MEGKIRPVRLGVRIGIVFLIALNILIFAAYVVVSKNVQNMLTDYTLQLMRSIVQQGVMTVEYELHVSQNEVVEFAKSFTAANDGNDMLTFPSASSKPKIYRMTYTTEEGTLASDGRQRDLRDRADIIAAFEGEPEIYGPYFNEEEEYVICYSAPVIEDGEVAGVLSVEKDGYYFSTLIKDMQFMSTGESYIINEEGTDIAVSEQSHIEWVNDQYNASRLLKQQEDAVTRSVLELEQKGQNGETGYGTYYWNNGLCYLFYAPIPSTKWVLLSGVREEELAGLTQSALYETVADSPVFSLCIVLFLLLTGLIIFWIVSSFKKNTEINMKLKKIANYDPLTGTLNRNSFHEALDILSGMEYHTLACIYIDANGLHEINNHLGHQAGDNMLKAVVEVLHHIFSPDDVYRIGGDEFVVFCKNQKEQEVYQNSELARKDLKTRGYDISVGIEWRDSNINIKTMVNLAEESMKLDKQQYYEEKGNERQIRLLDQKLEKMVLEKQDADVFLSILAPEFRGVYFVDLGKDTVRHLYIPDYFEEMLMEADEVFSKALMLYTERAVKSEYRQALTEFCDYKTVERQLNNGAPLELVYQKTDDSWLKLRVLKFKTYTEQCRETLWIFSNTNAPRESIR